MTNKEFFLRRLEEEHPIMMRVFQALPEGKMDYSPHANNNSAETILGTIVGGASCCIDMVQKGEFDYDLAKAPTMNLNQLIEAYNNTIGELKKAVGSVDDQTWNEKTVRLSAQGQTVVESPLGEFLWMILFDQVHHRGQLSSYIRPMGGKVPSIYGPSGDDPGGSDINL
jgi:uncharacterized damage-inducible protein DinB